jgi:hypothetical protein
MGLLRPITGALEALETSAIPAEIEELKENHSSEIEELKTTHSTETDDMRERHWERRRVALDAQLKKLEADLRKKIDELDLKYGNELKKKLEAKQPMFDQERKDALQNQKEQLD